MDFPVCGRVGISIKCLSKLEYMEHYTSHIIMFRK